MKLKYIEDYYDQLQERFPDAERWEIEKILQHGFRALWTLNSAGADVIIGGGTNGFSLYFGKLFSKNNNETWSKYLYLKRKIKARLQYILKNPIWDGYVYASLSEEENKQIPLKKGRYKRKVILKDVFLHKSYEEAIILRNSSYVYKIKLDKDPGYLLTKVDLLETRNIELYAKRDKDGKYQLINGKTRSN